jgi:hypothetical protein
LQLLLATVADVIGVQFEVAIGVQFELAIGVQFEVAIGVQFEVAIGVQFEVAIGVQFEVAINTRNSPAKSSIRESHILTMCGSSVVGLLTGAFQETLM